MQIQPKAKGRKPVSARAGKQVREAVERDAVRWGCSKSWIIHTALAAFYGVEIATPAQAAPRRREALRRRRAA